MFKKILNWVFKLKTLGNTKKVQKGVSSMETEALKGMLTSGKQLFETLANFANSELERPQIKVFVTKTRKFRAKIKDSKEAPAYEVTIGGQSWNEGKGREHEEAIKRKCQLLVNSLLAEIKPFK